MVYSSARRLRRWGTLAAKPILASQCRPAQSIPIRTLKLVKGWSTVHHPRRHRPGLSHPGFTVESRQMSRNWDDSRSELVPRTLISTCCLSTRYISVRVSIYRSNVKRTGVVIPRCYNSTSPMAPSAENLCWPRKASKCARDPPSHKQTRAISSHWSHCCLLDSEKQHELCITHPWALWRSR